MQQYIVIKENYIIKTLNNKIYWKQKYPISGKKLCHVSYKEDITKTLNLLNVRMLKNGYRGKDLSVYKQLGRFDIQGIY